MKILVKICLAMVIFSFLGVSAFADNPYTDESYADMERQKAIKGIIEQAEILERIKGNSSIPEEYEGLSFEDAVKLAEEELEFYESERELEGSKERLIEAVDAGRRAGEIERDFEENAQRTTILPRTTYTVEECKAVMNYVLSHTEDIKFVIKSGLVYPDISIGGKTYNLTGTRILGCGIKTGQIRLWMIPYYVRYILEFALQIAGLVSVGGIIFGGYFYLFAGMSDDKERGKNAIMYSVAGLILTLLAWAFVNIVISVLTS